MPAQCGALMKLSAARLLPILVAASMLVWLLASGAADATSINIWKHRYPFYGGYGGYYPFWGGYGGGGYGGGYGGISIGGFGGYGRR